jgi:hypothetical protein
MSIDNPGNFFNAEDFDRDDEDKLKPVNIYGQELFKKAIDILNITTTITDLLPEQPEERASTAALMLENAYKIPAKIKGAMGMEYYSLMMENAVVIKVNVMELKTQLWACEAIHGIEKKYTDVLKNEIAAFKELFIQWIKAFDKTNDLPDDWHLFNDPSTFPDDDEPFDPNKFFDNFNPEDGE